MSDPIVDEVRAIRARIAEECGYDLARMADRARQTAETIRGLVYTTPDEERERRRAETADKVERAK